MLKNARVERGDEGSATSESFFLNKVKNGINKDFDERVCFQLKFSFYGIKFNLKNKSRIYTFLKVLVLTLSLRLISRMARLGSVWISKNWLEQELD